MFYDHLPIQYILFFVIYSMTGVVPLLAAVYLLLRRGNAFAHDVTPPTLKIGVKVGYRGCGFGYMVNVGGTKGSRLTLGATGKKYSLNFRYHSFENTHPDLDMDCKRLKTI